MEPTRIEILKQMVEERPENSFARYALAIEFSRGGQIEEALENFEYLLLHQPEYAATYLQAGMILAKQGQRARAAEVFTKGIEINRRQGNLHAQGEIEAALEGLTGESQG